MIELDYVDDGAIACATLKRPPANALPPTGCGNCRKPSPN